MIEWLYPETWLPGDDLDAETLNRRIRDQNTLLLRRPMLAATRTTDFTLANTSETAISWDVVSTDDDGMCESGTPATSFTVQRNGTYRFWAAAVAEGNGSNGQIQLLANLSGSSSRWATRSALTSTSGWHHFRNFTGTVFMNVGETFNVTLFQSTGSNVTIHGTNAGYNCPRLVVMWLGVS